MSHDPEPRTRHHDAARDDLSTDPVTPPAGGARTSDDSVDPDAVVDGLRHGSHDPYQPL
jgi:hypothetical protein